MKSLSYTQKIKKTTTKGFDSSLSKLGLSIKNIKPTVKKSA
jgi:hypothetical protein